MKTQDLVIREELKSVTLDGYKPETTEIDGYEVDNTIDGQGSANWFVERLGMTTDINDEDSDGGPVLWCDYDAPGWKFSILIASEDEEQILTLAKEAGYDVVKSETITEPCRYGDGHCGTVAICKHPEGWIVLEN